MHKAFKATSLKNPKLIAKFAHAFSDLSTYLSAKLWSLLAEKVLVVHYVQRSGTLSSF